MAGSKKFDPSRKKLDKARADGDVAKSQDLTRGFSSLCGVLAVLLLGAGVGRDIWLLYLESLGGARDFQTKDVLVSLQKSLGFSLLQCLGVLACCYLAVLFIEIAQVGMVFSWGAIGWKWSRLSFWGGLRRICGIQDSSEGMLPTGLLGELGKQLVIFVLVGFVGVSAFRDLFYESVYRDCDFTGYGCFGLFSRALLKVALPMAGVIFGLGILDVLWVKHKRLQRLKMDFEEMRQEFRESEGDPEARSMRKQLHSELLTQGLIDGVRRAKVVILGSKKDS